MTITAVQETGNVANSTTTVNKAFASEVAVGSLIVVGVATYESGGAVAFEATHCSKLSGTATIGTVALHRQQITATYQQAAIWSAIVTGAGTLTMQVTGRPVTSYLTLGIGEYSTGTSWDANRAEAGNVGTGTASPASSGDATSAGEALFIGQLAVDTSGPLTITEDAAFALIHEAENGAANETGSTIRRIVTGGTTDAASWTITGTISAWAATVQVFKAVAGGATVSPVVGTYQFVGQTPTVGFTHSVAPSVGALVFAGQQPSVGSTQAAAPSVGTVRFDGLQPTVSYTTNAWATPTAGTFRFDGQQPSVTYTTNAWAVPTVGTFRFDGQQPSATVSASGTASPLVGTLRFVGATPTISFTDHMTVAPSVGTLRFEGLQPSATVSEPGLVSPLVGTLRFDGQTPTVGYTSSAAPSVGTLQFAGQQPTVSFTDHVVTAPQSGALILSGGQPTVAQTGHVWIDPSTGELRFVGDQPTTSVSTLGVVEPQTGVLRFIGDTPLVSGGVAANDTGTPGGSGYPVNWQGKRRKRRLEEQPNLHLKKVLDDVVKELYGELTEDEVPKEVQAKAAKLVKPFVKKTDKKLAIPPEAAVDWQALEKDAARVRQIVALWRKQEWEAEIDAEDEYLLLMA